jgi:hypothetical protein
MRSLAALLPLIVILAIVPLAFADPPGTNATATSPPTPSPAPTPVVGTHGLAPLPNDEKVPAKWLPPGAFDPDTGPSTVIYPPQQLTVRFDHKKHLSKDVGATCKTCHSAAYKSASAQDKLTPGGTLCDACHGTDHTNLDKVIAGSDATGQCGFCHQGYSPANGNTVAHQEMPRANLLFDHKKHVDHNIGCAQCHGAVQELELATRDQLPRMRGCFGCHQMPDSASRGEAKSACETCHVRGPGATRIRTMFPSGVLEPPRWLHNAEHTPDFILRHKWVAGNDSQFCSNCHTEKYCADCHDGRIRPRSVHPNDYISMHAIEARMATQRCTSCHHEQSFCLGCHERVGISMSGPPGVRESGRFHPPKQIWSDPPRQLGHHAFEAERNLNACVSCHIERDCVVCHGAQGVGGGFDPHKTGFVGGCGAQFKRNPRPCFVCHEPSDGRLSLCR